MAELKLTKGEISTLVMVIEQVSLKVSDARMLISISDKLKKMAQNAPQTG